MQHLKQHTIVSTINAVLLQLDIAPIKKLCFNTEIENFKNGFINGLSFQQCKIIMQVIEKPNQQQFLNSHFLNS